MTKTEMKHSPAMRASVLLAVGLLAFMIAPSGANAHKGVDSSSLCVSAAELQWRTANDLLDVRALRGDGTTVTSTARDCFTDDDGSGGSPPNLNPLDCDSITAASCTHASAKGLHGPFGCGGIPTGCWDYDTGGQHILQELSFFLGGTGTLESKAFNSGWAGGDQCIIPIGNTICFTRATGREWQGPEMFPCVSASAKTFPNVGGASAALDTGNCDIP